MSGRKQKKSQRRTTKSSPEEASASEPKEHAFAEKSKTPVRRKNAKPTIIVAGNGDAPPLRISHRLLTCEANTQRSNKRARKALPSPPAKRSTTNNSTSDPIYRGSIQEAVLRKLEMLDESAVQGSPTGRQGVLPSSKTSTPEHLDLGGSPSKSEDSKSSAFLPENNMLPRITYRPEILPQSQSFRKGDHVTILSTTPGQEGVIVKMISKSWFMVRTTREGATAEKMHSSQLRRKREQSVEVPEKFTSGEIRMTFWKFFEEEINRTDLKAQSTNSKIDFYNMARVHVGEALGTPAKDS